MKKHKKICFIFPAFIIFLLIGCCSFAGESVKNPSSSDTLAIIGDRIITVSGFKKKCDNLERRNPRMRDSKKRKDYLDMLVKTVLFSLEARAKNIDKDKEVVSKINDSIDRILSNEYLQREISANANITDGQIKEYYDANPDEFKTVEKVKASHILIRVYPTSGSDGLAKAKARVKDLKKKLDNGADFADLARKNSDDSATKNKGGSLGYITRGMMRISPEFMEAVFSLKTGEISDPVESPHGFHIIKADAKIPEHVRPLDKAGVRIKATLEKEKQKKLMEDITLRLMNKYNVVIKSNDLDW